MSRWTFACITVVACSLGVFNSQGADVPPSEGRQLIRDPHFQQGFFLLEPKPGKRVVYGEIPGSAPGKPVWDLAQWSSRFALATNDSGGGSNGTWLNAAKAVRTARPGSPSADLALGVNAGVEYLETRKSTSEPWVHLLVQQDLADPPNLDSLSQLHFRVEARLNRSILARTNGYSPAVHAAQYLIYLTVANRNPKAPGFQECFWFGIPLYDNRTPHIPAYEAQDFGDTKLFIFTPGSDTFARKSLHDREWVVFEKDLLPLLHEALEHARTKGFIKGPIEPADWRPLGIFIGWEVPGVFDVDLQIRDLSLSAVPKQQP